MFRKEDHFSNDVKNLNVIMDKNVEQQLDAQAKVVVGIEGLDVVNKFFYKVDKSIQDGISGFISYFNTTNVFIDDIAVYKTKTPNITTLQNLRASLLDDIKNNKKFYNIADKKAPVLMGFDITLPELYTILENNSKPVTEVISILEEFSTLLDDILNSKKDELKIPIDKKRMSEIEKYIKDINKDISKVTSKHVLKDRKPVKQIIRNYNELDTVLVNTLSIGEKYRMEKLEDIYSLNEEIVMKLEFIYESFKKDTNIHKDDIKEFVLMINHIAKLVTAVTFLYYLYFQLLNMISGVIKISNLDKVDNSTIDAISGVVSRGSKLMKNYTTSLLK